MKKVLLYAMLMLLVLLGCQPAQTAMPESPAVQETVEPVVQETAPIVQEAPAEPSKNESPLAPPVANTEQTLEGVKEFNIEAYQFGYEPSEIHVKKGDKVIIHLTARDVPHSLNLGQFGVLINAAPENPGTGEFVANAFGTYRWFCSIPCGSGHGKMEGKLIVE